MWIFDAAAIALLVGLVILNKIVKKKTDTQYWVQKGIMPDITTGQAILGVVARVIMGLLMIFLVFFTILINFWVDDYWIYFSDSRREKLTQHYGITFDSEVKPRKYTKMFGGPDGAIVKFQVKTEKSPERFIEENMGGKILYYNVGNETHYAPYYWEIYPPQTDEEREMAENSEGELSRYAEIGISQYSIENDRRKSSLKVTKQGDDSYLVMIY